MFGSRLSNYLPCFVPVMPYKTEPVLFSLLIVLARFDWRMLECGGTNFSDIMKCSIWKYVLALAATGAVGTVMLGVSKVAVDAARSGQVSPELSGSDAEQVAQAILHQKCADCHGPEASYSKFWNALSFGKLARDVDGAQRAYKMVPDLEIRSANVDYLKMDHVLRTRRMPPAAYTMVHLGSRLTPLDVSILRNRYKEQGAELRRFAPISPAAEPETEWDRARIRLGQLLYHHGALSTNNQVSCSSCHDLTKGGTDNLSKSEGVPGADGLPQLGGVNAPTTYNTVGNIRQFWDGRAADLKEQAAGPPLNPVEMGYSKPEDWADIADKLAQDDEIRTLFALVYGGDGITGDTITDAIAAFEKTLVTPDSAFDAYLKGNKNALTEKQKKGMESFVNRGCATCHSGPALGGISFEYINTHGDLRAAAAPEDYQEGAFGLRDFTKREEDKDMFRVPVLRNVAMTAPYFHTGSVQTLEEAVRVMCASQVGVSVSDAEVESIAAFLRAQTGKLNGRPLQALTPEETNPYLAKPTAQ